jgi:rhomboid family GlyGly-CTERM serine protease
MMETKRPKPWWNECRWTLGLCAVMTLLNLGLFTQAPPILRSLVDVLQFDRQAILDGQIWRLLTGNLVHWSVEHFLLDVGAFAIVGVLYERHLRPHYPWMLLASGLAVGCGVLVLMPQMAIYRGLSGVDSGQFAAALCVEVGLAVSQRRRWLWAGPAAVIFFTKILYEATSGQLFFGTEALGSIGLPTPLAHIAGAVVGICLTVSLLFLLRPPTLEVADK